MARSDSALHCIGDALPVATSHAEPYACKQTTAFGGLANFILIDKQSKDKYAIILSIPNKKGQVKPVTNRKLRRRREDTFSYENELRLVLCLQADNDPCLACELHFDWQAIKR